MATDEEVELAQSMRNERGSYSPDDLQHQPRPVLDQSVPKAVTRCRSVSVPPGTFKAEAYRALCRRCAHRVLIFHEAAFPQKDILEAGRPDRQRAFPDQLDVVLGHADLLSWRFGSDLQSCCLGCGEDREQFLDVMLSGLLQ